MSAVTSTSSPTIRFAGKRPASIAGEMLSMTIRASARHSR